MTYHRPSRVISKQNILGAAVVMTMALSASASYAQTLSQAVRSAYKTSGLVEQNQALLEASKQDIEIARAALRPTLSYAASATRGNNNASLTTITTGTASLTANLLLFDFGRSKAAVDVQNQLVEAAKDSMVGIEQQVILRTVSAYLSVLSSQENLQLQKNSVRVLAQELRAAEDRFEVGEVTRTDVALAQSRLAAARSGEAAAEGNLAISREEFNAAVGYYPTALSPAPAPKLMVKTQQEAQSLALSRHPDIRAANHNLRAAELGVDIASQAHKPSVTGQVQGQWQRAGFTSGSTTTSGSVGVFLQGQIYAGGSIAAQSTKAKAQVRSAKSQVKLVKLSVKQRVANAWARITIARASIKASERQIRASRVALGGAREEASVGARTTLDVLNAEQELLRAESAKVSAESDLHLALYTLLSEMGVLTRGRF